jgi:nucleoside-diphosphate-sugar epimerase
MQNKLINDIIVDNKASIKEAMRAIDQGSLGIAFLVDNHKKLSGIVTDGDVRRAVMKGTDIQDPVATIANKAMVVVNSRNLESDIEKLKTDNQVTGKIPLMGSLKIPVVDSKGRIENLVYLNYKKEVSFANATINPAILRQRIKTVVLLGGAGYLGSVLSRLLIKSGYKVRVLDNLTYGDSGIKDLYNNPSFEFKKGDVRNISDVVDAVKGAGAVIHLAAIVGDAASGINPQETIEINYLSAKSVAEACKVNQVNKLLFASTCSVYGASKNPSDKLSEESELNPVSLYAKTKLESEKGILSLADENFLPTIFRFATLFGVSPRMRFDLVVNIMTANALSSKTVTVFGGEQWRPNLSVTDAAKACLLWVQSPIQKTGGQIMNVGGDDLNMKIMDIAKLVQKTILGIAIDRKENEQDKRDYYVSFAKAKALLGFKPKKSIPAEVEGIKKLIEAKSITDTKDFQYSNYGFLVNSKTLQKKADDFSSAPRVKS